MWLLHVEFNSYVFHFHVGFQTNVVLEGRFKNIVASFGLFYSKTENNMATIATFQLISIC
jgi:hypothetical protein